MGFRLRKSITLAKGIRLNLSKSGLGLSVGVKGARLSFGPKGTRATVGIPGSGLYYETSIRASTQKASSPVAAYASTSSPTDASAAVGCLWLLGFVLFFMVPPAWKFLLALLGIGTLVVSAKKRREREEAQREAERKRQETDQCQAEAVRASELVPLADCPLALKKGEVVYYAAPAILMEERAQGPKLIDQGRIFVGSRKIYFLGDTGTVSFDLQKILDIELHSDAIEILREGRRQNQIFITEFPQTLEAYIRKAMALRKLDEN